MAFLDKQKIVDAIVEELKSELAGIMKSAEAAHGGAKHEDAVAKSKYDTHGLELSYLAGAQFERASVLRSQIGLYLELVLKKFAKNHPIQMSALVELASDDENLLFFLGIKGVSVRVQVDGKEIQVITPQSPLGSELLGLHEGDTVDVKRSGTLQCYSIIAVQ